ncbi:hypothetical protein KGF57_004130 [Candida theae]|uniref:Uncharacterized protein n=1 Tax=Candida theae TaxID=1198502 RepID=A0AAD5FX39_9ASCO|nr:uncharacterized protein KGF57_004130 [Candida theae]KAI5952924.1 hypothetical protein KGF57_004130 [Candida theae]
MSSFGAEEELPLQGCIVKIPLIIENESASATLSQSFLWTHVTRADYEPSADPNFINISLVSIWEEGYYHTTIKKQNIYNIFENSTSRKVNIDRNSTYDVFTDLFPLDLDTFLESEGKDGVHKQLLLSAKVNVPESSFKKGEGLNPDTLQIQIKSTGTFNPTVGKFDLNSVDFESSENLKDEGNLFNWMQLFESQNKELVKRLIQANAENDRLQTDNTLLQRGIEQTKKDCDEIITDLESKFYQEMNLKKDVIFELSKNELPKTELLGLNATFLAHTVEKENARNENKKKGARGKRVKQENETRSKRRKIKRKKVDSVEEGSDFRNDTDYTDVEHADENAGEVMNIKVKKEPEQIEKPRRYNLRSQSNTRVKKEPEYGNQAESPRSESNFVPHVKKEPCTQITPKSPELKDDSNPITVKSDPDVNSTPFSPDSFTFSSENSQDNLKVESLLWRSRNPSLNIERDRDIFNKAVRLGTHGKDDVDKDEEVDEENDNGTGCQETDEQTVYSSDGNGGSSDQDQKSENEREDGDKGNDEVEYAKNATDSKSQTEKGSFIEDSLRSVTSESKRKATDESQNRTDYSDDETKKKKDNDKTKSQQAASQADVETDYSDDDDDDDDDDE